MHDLIGEIRDKFVSLRVENITLQTTVETLVDLMERSDRAEFDGGAPVSSGEWFSAIEQAKKHLRRAACKS